MIKSFKNCAFSLYKIPLRYKSNSKPTLDYKTFEAKLPEILKHDKTVLVFKGTIDAATGKNWCSGCVVSEPHIDRTIVPIAEEYQIPVYFVEVGNRKEYFECLKQVLSFP